MNKLIFALLGITTGLAVFGAPSPAVAHNHIMTVCCSEQVEVKITPFNLVTGAYQGRFVEQGIPGFAVFEQQVASGQITAKDLVRAAYMDYRATYEDLMGETDFIDRVDQYLDGYTMGR